MYLWNPIWWEITDNVNDLGVATRTMDQVKKKWADLKRIVKSKLGKINQVRFGNESPCCVEEKIEENYTRDQVVGIGQMDVMAMADEEENIIQQDDPPENEDEGLENEQQPEEPTVTAQPAQPSVSNSDTLGLTREQMIYMESFMKQMKSTMVIYGHNLDSIDQSLKTMTMIMWRDFELRNPNYSLNVQQSSMELPQPGSMQSPQGELSANPSNSLSKSTYLDGSESLFTSTSSNKASTPPNQNERPEFDPVQDRLGPSDSESSGN